MTTPTLIEALREMVACAETSVPYMAINSPGFRWHDAVKDARAAIAAPQAEKAEPVAWQIAGHAAIIGYPERWDTARFPTLDLAVRFALARFTVMLDVTAPAPKATP